MKSSFTLEQVRSFLAVAEHESVSRAAESLHLTQGAVTQQLHNFEKAVGLRLVERGSRGVRLTSAGLAMAATCRGALRGVEVVAESARALRTLEAGSIHIGASPTCASYYLPPLLNRFTTMHPDVTLSMAVEPSHEICEEVRSGAVDCGLIEGEPDPGLVAVVVASDELVLVAAASHPLASIRHVTASDLAQHRYLGRGRLWSAEDQAREMIGDAYDRSAVLNLGHPEYVRAAALAGLGYAVLPVEAVKQELEAGRLVQLPVPSKSRDITAVRRAAAGGPTLEEFWRLATQEAQAAAR